MVVGVFNFFHYFFLSLLHFHTGKVSLARRRHQNKFLLQPPTKMRAKLSRNVATFFLRRRVAPPMRKMKICHEQTIVPYRQPGYLFHYLRTQFFRANNNFSELRQPQLARCRYSLSKHFVRLYIFSHYEASNYFISLALYTENFPVCFRSENIFALSRRRRGPRNGM